MKVGSETRRQGNNGKRRAKRVDAPEISVIIVNYNVKEFLQQALLSLRKALEHISAEVFVVDNASDDGSAEMVSREFPEITLIENTRNIGFARANNAALRMARGKFLALVNPDTIAQEDTFSTLLAFMREYEDAGMVGCKILNPDGSLQLACRRSFPTPWVAFTRLTGLSYLFPKSRWFGRYNLSYLPEDEVAAVEAISGSFMLMRREAFEQVGLLDEDFFLYGEDLDWCYRTIEAGWRIYYVPTTKIIHFKGESSRRSRMDNLLVFYRSMALFAEKHFRKKSYSITYFLLLVAIWIRAALSFLRNSLQHLAAPLIDFVLMQLSLVLALLIKFGHLQHWDSYLPVNAVYTAVWLASLLFAGSYGKWKFSFFKASMAALSGFIFNSAFTYFFKQFAFSRAVVLLAGAMNMFFLGGWRLLFKVLHRLGLAPFRGTLGHTLLARRTLVVGDFARGERVLEKLKARIGEGYEFVGLISLSEKDIGMSYNGLRVLSVMENISEVIRRKNIREVIFSTHRIPYDRILEIISENRAMRVSFKLIPSNLDVIIGKASIDQLRDVPLVDIDYKLSRPMARAVKRALDATLAALLLLLGAPLFAAQAIRKKPTRVEQEIVAGRETAIRLATYEIEGSAMIGKLLRLWHVLRGRMSFVGYDPRESQLASSIFANLRPGLTGLPQIQTHAKLTRQERERHYLFYLMNYSPLLDIEILFKACFKSLTD